LVCAANESSKGLNAIIVDPPDTQLGTVLRDVKAEGNERRDCKPLRLSHNQQKS